MKKFLLPLVFLFLFTSCNDPSKDAELLPVEKAEVKEVEITGMVDGGGIVNDGLVQVKNSKGYDFISSDGKLLRGDYPFIKQGNYLGLERFFVQENEESGYIIDSKGKVIADNFMGRPILAAPFGFKNGFLGVVVKKEPNDTVFDFRESGVKAKGDVPVMYTMKDPNIKDDNGRVWGTIDVDGNVYRDGSPSVLGYVETKEGYRVNYGYSKREVTYYEKDSGDAPDGRLFGLFDPNENKPITELLYVFVLGNVSSSDKSGSLAVITKDFDLLWIDTQGNTILDIAKNFPNIGEKVTKEMMSKEVKNALDTKAEEKAVFYFASKDALVLKSSKNSKAIVVGKDGKVLGGLDVEEFSVFNPVGKYTAYKNHEGKWGVLRDDLKVVVEPSYDDITSVDKNCFVGVRGEKTFLCTIVE